MWIPFLCF